MGSTHGQVEGEKSFHKAWVSYSGIAILLRLEEFTFTAMLLFNVTMMTWD